MTKISAYFLGWVFVLWLGLAALLVPATADAACSALNTQTKTIDCDTQGEAYAGCVAGAADGAAQIPSYNYACNASWGANTMRVEGTVGGAFQTGGFAPYATYYQWTTACSAVDPFQGWVTFGTYSGGVAPPAPQSISVSCNSGCLVIADGPSSCASSDIDGNGVYDDDVDTYSCEFSFAPESTGAMCSSSNFVATPSTTPNPPNNNDTYFDCTNVDCSSPPAPGGGGGGGGGGSGPGDDGGTTPPPPDPNAPPPGGGGNTGGNAGTGDNDPNTPGGTGTDTSTGTGTGDTDGDGERNVDCNPLSNPDCPFAGSATSSGDCAVSPACSGDPVQCTSLRQLWLNMCFPFTDTGTALIPWVPLDGTELDSFTDEVDINADGGVTQEGWLGTASCPVIAPAETSVGSFAIDFQPFCDVAQWLSYLIMFVASLTSMRIVFA